MSGKSSRAANPQNRTDTMIGAGMRVVGDIGFTGTLRIQGDVLGDVACDGDAAGTVVVDAPGSLTGTLEAPRVVVRGRVIGPVRSSQSIDIQQGGSIVGDAFYRAIDIHGGGVIEGLLTPTGPVEAAPVGECEAGSPAGAHALPPADGESLAARLDVGRMLAAAALLAIAAVAAVWLVRTPEAPRAADAVSAETAPAKQAPPPAAPTASLRAQEPRTAAEPAAPVPPPQAVADAAPPSADDAAAGAASVVTVQGVNPAKPGSVFLLVSKEPTVLYRKKRQEPGEGRRIEVSAGRTVSLPIGRNEAIRVAEGRDIEIFYQGRKVAPKTIESGAWMSFVPQGARAAGEDRQEESEGGAAR